MKVQCPKCQATNSEDAEVCSMCGEGLTPGTQKEQAEQRAAREEKERRRGEREQARQQAAEAAKEHAAAVGKEQAEKRAALNEAASRVYELQGLGPRRGVLLMGFAATVLCWWAGGYLLSLQAQSSSSLIESIAHGIGIYFLGKGCFIAALLTAVGSGEGKRHIGHPRDLSELGLLEEGANR